MHTLAGDAVTYEDMPCSGFLDRVSEHSIPILFVACIFIAVVIGVYYAVLHAQSFGYDRVAGLSSSTFDLEQNIESGDARRGLDTASKMHILWLMLRYQENFDDARLRYVRGQFRRENIREDGLPQDPKAVFFVRSEP